MHGESTVDDGPIPARESVKKPPRKRQRKEKKSSNADEEESDTSAASSQVSNVSDALRRPRRRTTHTGSISPSVPPLSHCISASDFRPHTRDTLVLHMLQL